MYKVSKKTVQNISQISLSPLIINCTLKDTFSSCRYMEASLRYIECISAASLVKEMVRSQQSLDASTSLVMYFTCPIKAQASGFWNKSKELRNKMDNPLCLQLFNISLFHFIHQRIIIKTHFKHRLENYDVTW